MSAEPRVSSVLASTVDGVERSIQPGHEDHSLRGRRLGSYVIGERIGQGAMGTVYQATHHSLGHMVAIKVIQASIVGDSALAHERFFREARAAARLEHEGIVRVIDFAREPTVGSYIVMELVRGQGLDTLVGRTPPLSAGELASIGAAIAESLQVAHEGGVIHRDLKPANVLVAQRDSRWRIKVADFGVAKVVDTPEHFRTKTGKLIGTPFYMSPEQWRGERVDPRSDIYSLGVLLYELASGTLPHMGNAYEIAYRVANEPPPPLGTSRPDLPADLIAVIERCLRKSPVDRHATMADVKHALDLIAERELPPRSSLRSLPPSSGAPSPPLSPLPRWVPVVVVATAVIALAALVLASRNLSGSSTQQAATTAPPSASASAAPPPLSTTAPTPTLPAVGAPSGLPLVVSPTPHPATPSTSRPARPPASSPRPAATRAVAPDEQLHSN